MAVSNTFDLTAVIRILERKGLISSDEVLEEVGKLKEEMDDKIRRKGRKIGSIICKNFFVQIPIDFLLIKDVRQKNSKEFNFP